MFPSGTPIQLLERLNEELNGDSRIRGRGSTFFLDVYSSSLSFSVDVGSHTRD